MVVIAHAVSALAKPVSAILALHHSPVAIVSNGGGGVHIFFVLSGFVLARPAQKFVGFLGLVQFYLRRALRIHPPYVVGLLVSWVLSGWIYDRTAPVEALSQAMIDLRRIHISPGALQHALMFPGRAYVQLPVGWTLQVEALFSILLPGLMLVALRAHWLLLVIVSIPMLLIENETTFDFLRFALDFSFGIAIYCEREALAKGFARLPGFASALVLTIGVALLSSPGYFLLDAAAPVRSLVLYCSGATLIVMCAAFVPAVRRVLSKPLARFVGRISYSAYLIHAPIIILLTPYVDHALNFYEGTLFVMVCLIATYAISPLVYYGVEEPSMRAGYWASKKLEVFKKRAEGEIS
ncbi:MAG: peptidoglycan/LPS O-acetylase OafA/YrhL [Myxococcota bacterium]|jgi:peptidoglycan/LPS O-acetylase OafA/YrhL